MPLLERRLTLFSPVAWWWWWWWCEPFQENRLVRLAVERPRRGKRALRPHLIFAVSTLYLWCCASDPAPEKEVTSIAHS